MGTIEQISTQLAFVCETGYQRQSIIKIDTLIFITTHSKTIKALTFHRFIPTAMFTVTTRHSDIGPSAYFAKLGKKKVNEEKEIEKHRK